MMKKQTKAIMKLAVFLPLVLPLAACTAGKIDPAKALTQMHIVKNDNYKKRPGWDVLVWLGIDDCKTSKRGGGSLFKWDGLTCDDKSIIKSVNEKPQIIPIFYAAYHEYGSDEVGSMSTLEPGVRTGDEMAKILVNLATVLSNQARIDAIYDDYENDRWSMGLNEVSKSDFTNGIAIFTKNKDALASSYQKLHSENQARDEAEKAASAKRQEQAILASDRPIVLVLWPNPTPEQQIIIDALNTIKFSVRSDRVAYANGRWFMGIDGLEYLRNSLDMSMASCSDVGAYVGEKVLSISCVRGMARDIVKWGETAKDSSISDRAWRYAAGDGSINYNPIKYEIIFSHWAGMARVYASRGY